MGTPYLTPASTSTMKVSSRKDSHTLLSHDRVEPLQAVFSNFSLFQGDQELRGETVREVFDIPAGGSQTLEFVLAWHFPNRVRHWDQRLCACGGDLYTPSLVSLACSASATVM